MMFLRKAARIPGCAADDGARTGPDVAWSGGYLARGSRDLRRSIACYVIPEMRETTVRTASLSGWAPERAQRALRILVVLAVAVPATTLRRGLLVRLPLRSERCDPGGARARPPTRLPSTRARWSKAIGSCSPEWLTT